MKKILERIGIFLGLLGFCFMLVFHSRISDVTDSEFISALLLMIGGVVIVLISILLKPRKNKSF